MALSEPKLKRMYLQNQEQMTALKTMSPTESELESTLGSRTVSNVVCLLLDNTHSAFVNYHALYIYSFIFQTVLAFSPSNNNQNESRNKRSSYILHETKPSTYSSISQNTEGNTTCLA